MKTSIHEELEYKPFGVWEVYPDPEATHLEEKWWHRFIFWKKFKYQEWKMKREYMSMKKFMEEMGGTNE